ncbi:MAG: hypothetical protein WAT53_00050 [Nitrosomonas sp.]
MLRLLSAISPTFITANPGGRANRKTNRLLVEKIDLPRSVFKYTKQRCPFRMDAVVIFPDHLHGIQTLPQAEADCSTRWNMLKGYFSRYSTKGEKISTSRKSRREREIW